MSIQNILEQIESQALDESIQELIKDFKATQHGDRTNPAYEILKDHHTEGSVWKHSKLALGFLPEIAKELSTTYSDPDYEKLYLQFLNELRHASLFHDIGKIVTQQPSSKRAGSFSFPKHSNEEIVKELFSKYDIEYSDLVLNLIAHHHDSPEEMKGLQEQEWPNSILKLLVILKAVDNMAVGSTSSTSAVQHVEPYVKLIK